MYTNPFVAYFANNIECEQDKMGHSKIVTLGPVFILSDVFLAVAICGVVVAVPVIDAKTPYSNRSYGGCYNENVTSKWNFALG